MGFVGPWPKPVVHLAQLHGNLELLFCRVKLINLGTVLKPNVKPILDKTLQVFADIVRSRKTFEHRLTMT